MPWWRCSPGAWWPTMCWRVRAAVLTQLGLGLTAWAAQGGFSETPRTVLFCTVSRPEVNALEAAVRRADSGAFIVIGHGHQASGGIVRPGQRHAGSASHPASD